MWMDEPRHLNRSLRDYAYVTGWRSLIGCLKLQVIFRKRATSYRALLREMTKEDKPFYDFTPPCRAVHCAIMHVRAIHCARSHANIVTNCNTPYHTAQHCTTLQLLHMCDMVTHSHGPCRKYAWVYICNSCTCATWLSHVWLDSFIQI